ncbi:hypothetical protein [Caulobacter sp. S45]|uniref:hypothetical protein n=1 Tax=Caulobacter sp. S45 TaxID=1641861 RepID=UPI0015763942|nr:hypothetical protein [Caulobacter sp. S45]
MEQIRPRTRDPAPENQIPLLEGQAPPAAAAVEGFIGFMMSALGDAVADVRTAD